MLEVQTNLKLSGCMAARTSSCVANADMSSDTGWPVMLINSNEFPYCLEGDFTKSAVRRGRLFFIT